MTTPKYPSRPGPLINADSGPLNKSLNELDGLINDKASLPQETTGQTGIPILDEIIDPDETDYLDDMEILLGQEKTMESPPQESISHEQLENIIGNVEEKLAGELDTLVNILKDTIKDSIVSEIKSQLEAGLNKPKTGKPDGDSS
ncbi:MAG: hypothetical protein ACRESK_07675 [Gammaproteobacteria bacterium]